MKKIELEQAKKEISKRGYIPLFNSFNNVSEKLIFMDSDGYKYSANLNNIKNGRKPSAFGNNNPYTIYNIKIWLKKNNKRYKLVTEEFDRASSKLTFIDDEGYLLESKWNNIYTGFEPKRFDLKNSNTINNINLYLRLNNKKYKVLSKEYKGSKETLEFITEDGYILTSTWGCIQSGQDASMISKSNKHTIENIKLFLKNNFIDLELISDVFIDSIEKLDLKDYEGYMYSYSWSKLQQLKSPRRFSTDNKYAINNMRLFLKNNNIEYSLLSDKFEGDSVKLYFECPKHGKFESVWYNIMNGVRCRKCFVESNVGSNNSNWKGGITPLTRHLRNKVDKWKDDSFKMANYTCQISGQVGGDLAIHHIYSFKNILMDTLYELNIPLMENVCDYSEKDLRNIEDLFIKKHYEYGFGICLTKDIHNEFHTIYGKLDGNTAEQFYEFYKMKTGKEFKLREAS